MFSKSDGASDHHRVTLYRFHKVCWLAALRGSDSCNPWGKGNYLWSGWLVPTVRAGADSAATTIFLARDADRFEGVCGAAFFQNQPVIEKKLTDLPNIVKGSSEEDIKQYADETWVTPALIQKRLSSGRPCARWFLALRVEIQYKKWGVLMIDSRSDKMPQTMYKEVSARLDQNKDVISHLLKA